MKNLLLTLFVTVFCFSSCTKEESECVYIISHSVSESAASYSSDSEGKILWDQFTSDVIAWDKKCEADWQWVENISDNSYKKADARALEKFKKYNAEWEALLSSYQAKFDACSDKSSRFYQGFNMKLKRIGNQDKELANEASAAKLNY